MCSSERERERGGARSEGWGARKKRQKKAGMRRELFPFGFSLHFHLISSRHRTRISQPRMLDIKNDNNRHIVKERKWLKITKDWTATDIALFIAEASPQRHVLSFTLCQHALALGDAVHDGARGCCRHSLFCATSERHTEV